MMIKHPYFILCLVMAIFTLDTASQESFSVDSEIDWEKTEIRIDLSSPLPTENSRPGSRFIVENNIEENLPRLILEGIYEMQLNSRETILESIKQDRKKVWDFQNLIHSLEKVYSIISEDQKNVEIRYKLNFYPELINNFIYHDINRTVPISPLYITNEDFSGLLIYAGDTRPWQGTEEKVQLTPALFPRIYDEEMNLIFEKESVSPDYIRKWGPVQYIYETAVPEEYSERIGTYPLRISAFSFFGRNPTDIIIRNENALMLTGNKNNQQLFKEGRIVIILRNPEASN